MDSWSSVGSTFAGSPADDALQTITTSGVPDQRTSGISEAVAFVLRATGTHHVGGNFAEKAPITRRSRYEGHWDLTQHHDATSVWNSYSVDIKDISELEICSVWSVGGAIAFVHQQTLLSILPIIHNITHDEKTIGSKQVSK